MKYLVCVFFIILIGNVCAQEQKEIFETLTEGRTPVSHGERFLRSETLDYDIALNVYLVAQTVNPKSSLKLSLPDGSREVIGFRYLESAECCFIVKGFDVLPDPEVPLEKFTFTWIGKGERDTDVIITVRNGVATGIIANELGTWRLLNNKTRSQQYVRRVDPNLYVPDTILTKDQKKSFISSIPAAAEATVDQVPVQPSLQRKKSQSIGQKANNDPLKVLVLYTNNARIQASIDANGSPPSPSSSTADIQAVIGDSISSMNTALQNSGIFGATVQLAHAEQVSYNEATAAGLPPIEVFPTHLNCNNRVRLTFP